MGGDIAGAVRIGIIAPYTSDGVSLFDDYEVMPPGALEANCHADTAESGPNNRNRAAGQIGGFPSGCNASSLAKIFAIVGNAARRMLACMGRGQTQSHSMFLLKGSNVMRQRCNWRQTTAAGPGPGSETSVARAGNWLPPTKPTSGIGTFEENSAGAHSLRRMLIPVDSVDGCFLAAWHYPQRGSDSTACGSIGTVAQDADITLEAARDALASPKAGMTSRRRGQLAAAVGGCESKNNGSFASKYSY